MDRLPRSRAWDIDAAARRAFDLVIALAGLIVFFPLMLAIATAICIDAPGPVFFSQPRLGRKARLFRVYKFRKFPHGAGSAGPAVTLKNDRRMTRVGRVLEQTKLDELPQLWNVLIGDMSVVGPRPETLNFADGFAGPYRRVLDHRPGIFGPSQVIFRNESALYPVNRNPHEFYRTVLFPAKARIDLAYFSRRSFLSDIEWTIRGALAVFGLSSLRATCLEDIARMETRLWARQERVAADTVLKERN